MRVFKNFSPAAMASERAQGWPVVRPANAGGLRFPNPTAFCPLVRNRASIAFPRKPDLIKKRQTLFKKAEILFPAKKILNKLKKGHFARKIQQGAAVYMAAALEYLAAEILELSGHAAEKLNLKRISPRHLFLAVHCDNELKDLLKCVTIPQGGVGCNIHPALLPKKEAGTSKKPRKTVAINTSIGEAQPENGLDTIEE